jgi:ABC-2 type transport system ATP-binding protein
MNAIHTHNLCRSFGKTHAVQNLTLDIEPGAVFGLIGPDGAGKTTTLRMLAGVLRPDAGRAQVLAHDVIKNPEALRSKIGYMPQQFSLYGDLSVLENLQFFAQIYRIPRAQQDERIARLLKFAQLTQFSHRPAAKLSGGMKKKLGLACALIHNPQLLLLDEPTNGVDPVSRREFWDILSDLHLQGVTILISTPYMDEAERCTQVGLMFRGQLIRQGQPETLRLLAPGQMLVLYTSNLARAETLLPQFPHYLSHQRYGDRLHLFVPDANQAMPQLRSFLQRHQLPIETLYQDEPRLEEAFIHLIRQARQEEPA